MADDTTAPSRAPWPDASTLPAEDAPALAWAKFYRDALGWIPLPCAARVEVMNRAAKLVDEACRDWREMYRREPNEQEMEALRDEADEIAERAAKGPLGWIRAADYNFAGAIDDATLEKWFGGKQKQYRGIAIRPGRSSRGWPVVLLDVDSKHDADPAWANFPGPCSETPSGGRHVLLLGAGGPGSGLPHGTSVVAQGVDLVTDPGVTLRVPAGLGSTGPSKHRRWIRWEAPEPVPEVVLAAARARRPQAGGAGAGRPRGDGTPSGRAAAALREDAADGERNEAARAIVGILARPAACPDDVVQAALELLAEDLVGRDKASEEVRVEAERWNALLTRGPRTVEFAVEVLEAWSRVRDVARVRWRPVKARMVARSMWRTADRREEGKAGAEDRRIGPALADEPADAARFPGPAKAGHAPAASTGGGLPPFPGAPPTSPLPQAPSPSRALPPDADPDLHVAAVVEELAAAVAEVASAEPPAHPVPFPPPPPRSPEELEAARQAAAQAVAAAQRPPWQGRLFRSFASAYPRESFLEDLARQPVGVSSLPLFVNPLTLREDPEAGPYGHGLGPWAGGAFGGLVAGDCKAFGAASAKGGKTYYVGQVADGLALATAYRLRGADGWTAAPMVVPFWLSEMPIDGELTLRAICRYLGVSMKAITRGRAAGDEPDVIAAALRLERSPADYVEHVRFLVDSLLYNPDSPVALAYQAISQEIDLSVLPRASGTGRNREDPRGGPALVGHVADEIMFRRAQLAQAWNVAESEIQPLIVWDPLQRFTGDESPEAKAAIDRLLGAIVERLCRRSGGVRAIVLLTSDTTKSAAATVKLDHFLDGDPRELCAQVFAGSQGIMHHADCIAIYSEPPLAGAPSTTTWARILQSRSGAPPTAFPFLWETWCGRFRAQEPGRPRVAATGGGGGGPPSGGGNRPKSRPGSGKAAPARPFPGAPRPGPSEASA